MRTYVPAPGGYDDLWFFRPDYPRRLMVRGLNPLGLAYRYRATLVSFLFHGEHEHPLDVRMGARSGSIPPATSSSPDGGTPSGCGCAVCCGSRPLTALDDLGCPVLTDRPDIQYSPRADVRASAPRHGDEHP